MISLGREESQPQSGLLVRKLCRALSYMRLGVPRYVFLNSGSAGLLSHRITPGDYRRLWPYARMQHQMPHFGETTNFDQIKPHDFMTYDQINPNGMLPKGPLVDSNQPAAR